MPNCGNCMFQQKYGNEPNKKFCLIDNTVHSIDDEQCKYFVTYAQLGETQRLKIAESKRQQINREIDQKEDRKRYNELITATKETLVTQKISTISSIIMVIANIIMAAATFFMVYVTYNDYRVRNTPIFKIGIPYIKNGEIINSITKIGPGIAQETWHFIIIGTKDKKLVPKLLKPNSIDNNPYDYTGSANIEDFKYTISDISVKEKNIDTIFVLLTYKTNFKDSNLLYKGFMRSGNEFKLIPPAELTKYSQQISAIASKK